MNDNRNSATIKFFTILALLVLIGALLLSQIDALRTPLLADFVQDICTGALLSAFVLHLSYFILDRQRVIFLLFSIFCLMLALINRHIIYIFWEDINWFADMLIEYTISFLATLLFVWFLYMQYPKLLHKKVVIFISALLILQLLLLPFDIYFAIEVIHHLGFVVIAFFVYVFVRFIMKLRSETIQFILGFIGFVVFLLFVIHDALVLRNVIDPIVYADDMLTAPIGALFFVLSHTILIALDYIEVKNKEATLVEDNIKQDNVFRIKTDLFRNIAHDMKAPLTLVSSEVQNAMDVFDYDMDKLEICKSLANAQNEVMNMAKKIDKVIEEITVAEFSEGMKPLNVEELITDTASAYHNLLKLNGNILKIEIQDALPEVFGNSDSLSLTLSNLISNANRYTKNGSITITAVHEDEIINVTVSDDGLGIKKDVLPHIFKRGFSTGGTGLGLPICKTVVEMHNGEIWAESDGIRGVKIHFTLPAIVDSN